MKPDKLRLLLFSDCNRSCEGCCNNQFDLNAIPSVTDFSGYRKVILTGGEPMLKQDVVLNTIKQVRKQNPLAEVVMYTAKSKRAFDLIAMLHFLDGITLTLHEGFDVEPFNALNDILLTNPWAFNKKMLRLNVFAGIDISDIDLTLWSVKEGIEWIEDCPLPTGELFARLGEV